MKLEYCGHKLRCFALLMVFRHGAQFDWGHVIQTGIITITEKNSNIYQRLLKEITCSLFQMVAWSKVNRLNLRLDTRGRKLHEFYVPWIPCSYDIIFVLVSFVNDCEKLMCVCVSWFQPFPRSQPLLMLSLSHLLYPLIVNKNNILWHWMLMSSGYFWPHDGRSVPEEKTCKQSWQRLIICSVEQT